MMDDLMTGDDLRRWREELGWTQMQAADALGLGRSHYSQLENGWHPIRQPIVLATLYLRNREQEARRQAADRT